MSRDLEADRIAQDTQVSAALLIAANARIKELEAENATLKERLAKYESPDNASGNLRKDHPR